MVVVTLAFISSSQISPPKLGLLTSKKQRDLEYVCLSCALVCHIYLRLLTSFYARTEAQSFRIQSTPCHLNYKKAVYCSWAFCKTGTHGLFAGSLCTAQKSPEEWIHHPFLTCSHTLLHMPTVHLSPWEVMLPFPNAASLFTALSKSNSYPISKIWWWTTFHSHYNDL